MISKKGVLRVFLTLAVMFLLANSAKAQQDTLLQEVEVVDRTLKLPKTFQAIELDPQQRPAQNFRISQMLQEQGHLYIKDYGPGQLATAAGRGTGANHLDVLWEGVSINMPTLGMTNLGNLPVGGFSSATFYPGQSSLFNTNGQFGGSINLSAEPQFSAKDKTTNELSVFAGSFATYQAQARVMQQKEEYAGSTFLQYYTSANNYPFMNYTLQQPQREILQNAGFNGFSLMHGSLVKLDEKSDLSVNLWGQMHAQDIPRPISAVGSSASQEREEDRFLRSVIRYRRRLSYGGLILRGGYLQSQIDYRNPNFDALTITHTGLVQAHYVFSLAGWESQIGAEVRHERVTGENYTDDPMVNSGFVFGQIHRDWKRFSLTALMKNLWMDGQLHPTGSLAGAYQVSKRFRLRGNVGRNFRFATLNDRFYQPGGNPDLLPEEGYTAEFGFDVIHKKQNKISMQAFWMEINNWILWRPSNDGAFWSPQNVASVRSQGLEFSAQTGFSTGIVNWKMMGFYTYTAATQPIGNMRYQLIYIPKHQFRTTVLAGLADVKLLYHFRYTDAVFLDRTNRTYLPEFFINDVELQYALFSGKAKWNFSLAINNIFGYGYQVVASRPMPGRNAMVGVGIQF